MTSRKARRRRVFGKRIKITHKTTAPLHYYWSALGIRVGDVLQWSQTFFKLKSLRKHLAQPFTHRGSSSSIPGARDPPTSTTEVRPLYCYVGWHCTILECSFHNITMCSLGLCSEQLLPPINGSHGNRPLWNTDGKCPSTQLLPMSVDSDTSQQRSAALMLAKHFPGRAITTSGSTCRQHCEIKLFLKHIWNLHLYNLYPLKLINFLST